MNISQWKNGDRTFFSLDVDDRLLLILILINIYPQLLQIHPRTSHSSNGLSRLDNGRTCAEHRINFHHKACRQGSNNPHWFRLTTGKPVPDQCPASGGQCSGGQWCPVNWSSGLNSSHARHAIVSGTALRIFANQTARHL